jgi:hypothetical protein
VTKPIRKPRKPSQKLLDPKLVEAAIQAQVSPKEPGK